jgi:lipoic acid synthetase
MKPDWIKKKIQVSSEFLYLKNLLTSLGLNTVCQQAACPNISECWSKREATFIILGGDCTRRCLFCNVWLKSRIQTVRPDRDLGDDEPQRLAEAVFRLRLKYVVVTSVTRDDLEDRGVSQFINSVKAIKAKSPQVEVELLIPDMEARDDLLGALADSGACVIGHNIEMAERLYPLVRPGSDYRLSLAVLEKIKRFSDSIFTKSGLMLGLGETWPEIIRTLGDLRRSNVDILYIGQYLRPSRLHWPVEKFYRPEEFAELETLGKELGFLVVKSAPFVRSSFKADSAFKEALKKKSIHNSFC